MSKLINEKYNCRAGLNSKKAVDWMEADLNANLQPIEGKRQV